MGKDDSAAAATERAAPPASPRDPPRPLAITAANASRPLTIRTDSSHFRDSVIRNGAVAFA
jgi:hypothetical protein